MGPSGAQLLWSHFLGRTVKLKKNAAYSGVTNETKWLRHPEPQFKMQLKEKTWLTVGQQCQTIIPVPDINLFLLSTFPDLCAAMQLRV